MKIGVISDTHGDVKAWKQALKVFGQVSLIVHAGDILYHGPFNPILPTYDPLGLANELNKSPAPLIFARGNCDSSVDALAINYPIESRYAFTAVEGLQIMAHHGDRLDAAGMSAMAERYRVDIFVTGHTHIPLIERTAAGVILNPGSPSLPKARKIASVGLITIEGGQRKAEIVGLADGQPLDVAEL